MSNVKNNVEHMETKENLEVIEEKVIKKRTTRTRKPKLEEGSDNIEESKKVTKTRTRRSSKKTDNIEENNEEKKVKAKSPRKKSTSKKEQNQDISIIKEAVNEFGIEMEKSEKKVRRTTRSKTQQKSPSDFDVYLFHEGRHYECYNFMGAHFIREGSKTGVRFTTWAPKASKVTVVGDFSNWEESEEYGMNRITEAGLWSIFIPSLKAGEIYKYAVKNEDGSRTVLKSDPYAFASELRPNTASILVKDSKYKWKDQEWMDKRNSTNIYQSPVNIYEVHLGSWKIKGEEDFYTYKELCKMLPKYVKEMGYTHVEFMPIMEHPLDDSWGYQVTGYYSVTSRYGSIDDFKALVDTLHREGIGVILDWVPGHFCKDEHGLYRFDGTPTYEYEDPTKSENKGWGAANFDLGRAEVKSFLISNALYWFKNFHIDGLRVDAVANMLYLDYDRSPGEWVPNKDGGRENLEAIEFLRELNTAIFKELPNVLMIAEESTAWPMVTKPADVGGLGFNFKWNMGWMNDMLKYIELDPVYRKYHHDLITFSIMYQYSENFVLPISHDEVVHGKKSLVNKMWGDYWNKFAGLRLFASYMLGHPGKKTLFMGSEFGQFIEWRNREGLEFKLVDEFDMHRDTQKFFSDINVFYKENEALWKYDCDPKGFEWIDADNAAQSIIVFMRKADKLEDTLIYVCNFTPNAYNDFNIGVPFLGEYKEVFNTDSKEYGGSGQTIEGPLYSRNGSWQKQKYHLNVKVPPMGTLVLKPVNIIE